MMFVSKLAIFLIIYVTTGSAHQDYEFRFDYTYFEDAGGWLKLHKVPATWNNARFQCHAEGAVLASPLTDHLRHAMLHLATEVKPSSTIYTGIHATYAKSVFTSVEGVPLTRIPIIWSPQAPYNYNYVDSDSCLVMLIIPNHSGTVSDAKCSDANPYICYKKKMHLPAINECGTVDEEYKLYAKTGQCYKFHRFGLTWTSAYKTCVAEGGNLAVINSEEEFQILKDIFNNYPSGNIFSPHNTYAALGFSDPNDGSSWITVQGQTLKEAGFEQWESGEPNNASQPLGELCGVMARGSGKFYDAPCNWPLAFLCEKDPHSLKHCDFEFRFDYTYYEDAGGWLKLHKVPATWSNARFQCHAEGAVLASPLTEHLLHTMLHLASDVIPSSAIYTGIHATYAKSVFTSVEGVPLTRIPITWSPQAPYNYNYADSDSCLVMLVIPNHSGTVSDTKCSDANPYICYKKKTHLPALTDCGTVDEEYKFYAKTGQCYKFHRFGLTWTGAFKTCVAEGAYLAVINSEEEFQILKEIYNNYPNNKIFSRHTDNAALGFSNPNDGSNWITIQGQTLKEAGFELWGKGEPNNASQPLGEMCGFMKRGSGKFNDAPCNWPVPFICEKDPHSLKNI